MSRTAASGLAALILSSCGPAEAPLEARLLNIAREYPGYGRVDDRNRWAPELCASSPSRLRESASADPKTHGRKLYYLLAKDRQAYVSGRSKPQPLGQVIVKEAWESREVPAGTDVNARDHDESGGYIPYVVKDGRSYTTGGRHALFIMVKEAAGWTYGTVTADGTKVIQAGQLPSCIGCHRDAKPDSVFGLPLRD